MKRRDLLAWVSRGLAAGVATVVGLPGIQYLLGGTSADSKSEAGFARLMRLKDLVPNRPTLVPVSGQKQDAWVRHDRQIIGRVWLVREAGEPADAAGQTSVRAMSSICPHMGCQIQAQSSGKGFQCPCHRATFQLDGLQLPDPRSGGHGHSPRDLDQLDCRIVQDETTGDAWVEVRYERFETGLDHRVVSA